MTTRREGERRVAELTVSELVELIRQVLREEQASSDTPARGPVSEAAQATGERAGASSASSECFIDEDGRLAFRSEAAYAAYLAKQAGRHPAEVNAYYLDARGHKAVYEEALQTPAEGDASAQPALQERLEERRPAPGYDIQTSDTDRHEAARRRLRGG